MKLLAAAIWCLPFAALGAQHIVEIAWGGDGGFRHAALIAPGKFFEVCGKLAAGDTVAWQFEATAPVDFNIHYHQGKDAVFPVKLPQVAQGADSLRVAAAQDYCWMWTNKGAAPVQLGLELTR